MIWLLIGPSLATTLVVSSGSSIQTTIDGAASGDTIEIEAGTYSECLSFGGKDISLVGLNSVTINGSGCSTTATATVSGAEAISFSNLTMSNSNGYVVHADSETASVELDGVTISNSGFSNQGPSDEGGVIYAKGTVTIRNSTFSGNMGGLGGVLYMEGGSLSIFDSEFTLNSALKGGVIYAKDGTIISSENNEYRNNVTVSSGFGGVFSLQFTTSYIDDGSLYEGNESSGNGGVFYVNHNLGAPTPNVISISNARFLDNGTDITSTAAGKGGVFYVYNRSTISLTNSEFIENQSTGGGSLWVINSDDTVEIDNCLFDSNISKGLSGGAIATRGSATAPTNLNISGSVFMENIGDNAGGGAVAIGSASNGEKYGFLQVEGSSFQNNSTTVSSTAHGGAIFASIDASEDVSIINSSFEGNSSFSSGGAVYVTGTDSTLISLSSFIGNEATSPASYGHFGGAVFVGDAQEIMLNNTIFCDNGVTQFSTAHDAVGGAFYAQYTPDVTVHNVVFQDNRSEADGGGFAAYDLDSLDMRNNTFAGNSASTGAGIWLEASTATLVNNLVTHSNGIGAYADATTASSSTIVYGGWDQNTSDVSGFSMMIGTDGHVSGDPLYQNYTQNGDCSDDLLSLGTGSPFIDAGDPSIQDVDNSPSDIGAFGGDDLLDSDGDGFSALIDCDDADSNTYPGAAENDSLTACMQDADGDGYGSSTPDSAQVESGTDCDDGNVLVSPGALEVCGDLLDNDCNGVVNDATVGGLNYYADLDGDGFGENTPTQLCSPEEGYVEQTGDCNDLDPYTYPGAAEKDSTTACMQDLDQDGWGASTPASSEIISGSDCDDLANVINPDATETPADGFDANCDGNEDCYADTDLDGFGGTTITPSASLDCVGLAVAASADDCDDSDYNAYPGAAENDSTTACMLDADGDGYGSVVAPAGGSSGNDCDDSDPAVYFGAPEIPGDGVSQDCDNQEDCFLDEDGDGFGVPTIVTSADRDCDDIGESGTSDDCDDGSVDVSPGNEEVPYDEIDNDCDPSTVDDDLDNDGFGVDDGDCDDENPDVYPNAEDVPDDGVDQNCDGEDDSELDTDTEDTEDRLWAEEKEETDGCTSNSQAALGWMGLVLLLIRRRRDM